MKKLAAALSSLAYLSLASLAFADITITKPGGGYSNLGNFITNILQLSFGIAIVVVLIMLIWGAFEWITSGGDKEAVGKARNRIINALIGLAVLAVAYALASLGAEFLGISFPQLPVPKPS